MYRAEKAKAFLHVFAVHAAEGVGEQFDAFVVGAAEVDRGFVLEFDLHSRFAERCPGGLLGFGCDRDGNVMQPAQHLGVLAEFKAGEVEVGEQVAVTDVEEEVRRPGIVAVLK